MDHIVSVAPHFHVQKLQDNEKVIPIAEAEVDHHTAQRRTNTAGDNLKKVFLLSHHIQKYNESL